MSAPDTSARHEGEADQRMENPLAADGTAKISFATGLLRIGLRAVSRR